MAQSIDVYSILKPDTEKISSINAEPDFLFAPLEDYYRSVDDNADLPFPGEDSMQFRLPENRIRSIGALSELAVLLEEAEKDTEPENYNEASGDLPVIRIGFPEKFGTALVPPVFFPRRLIEACLLKVRNYLRDYGNKEYSQNKLLSQLMGKESSLREMLNRITLRPLDCYNAIAEGGEFSYLFWAHFCVLVRNDVTKKKDYLSNDIAVVQAVYIIEAVNIYYKNKATKAKEKEHAYRRLEQCLGKPPYLYTLEDIIKFKSASGVLLLAAYTRDDLAEQIKILTNERKEDELPRLLVLTGPKKERFFVMKNKMALLCIRLLIDTRDRVKRDVSKHWIKLLRNYKSEPAMENDREFEKTLYQFTQKICPMLNCILEDPKFQLVYEEMEQVREMPVTSKFFALGTLLPYSTLFYMRRKEVLEDARLNLPVWYSMPILVSIMAFFKNLFRREEMQEENFSGKVLDSTEDTAPNTRNKQIYYAAREIESIVVPRGHTLDTYLNELKGHWSRLIDKKARDNLIEDVNSLIRDNLRQTLRVQKQFRITRDNLVLLAGSIMNRSPNLQDLNSKDFLRTYIELYLVKLLLTIRF